MYDTDKYATFDASTEPISTTGFPHLSCVLKQDKDSRRSTCCEHRMGYVSDAKPKPSLSLGSGRYPLHKNRISCSDTKRVGPVSSSLDYQDHFTGRARGRLNGWIVDRNDDPSDLDVFRRAAHSTQLDVNPYIHFTDGAGHLQGQIVTIRFARSV